jgi:hypothetical protein
LRTPAPVRAAPPSWSRHPQTFTAPDSCTAAKSGSRRTHLKGHGGAKFAAREVRDHLTANRLVWTGVKSLLSLHQPSDATGQLAEAVDRRLFLHALDAAVAKLRLLYVPFIDDILILAPTRWQLPGVRNR